MFICHSNALKITKKHLKLFYLNKKGEEVIKCDKDIRQGTAFINGMAMIEEKGEYSIIDDEGLFEEYDS